MGGTREGRKTGGRDAILHLQPRLVSPHDQLGRGRLRPIAWSRRRLTFCPYFRDLAQRLQESQSDDDAMRIRRELSAKYDIEVVGPPMS